MKTHVLTVSRTFPKGHKKEGQSTFFIEKIKYSLFNRKGSEGLFFTAGAFEKCYDCLEKIHTCRSNYPLWSKRIKEVQEGKAVLSLRYWEGKPYRSKQIEFFQLDKNSGIGIQELKFGYNSELVKHEKYINVITKPYVYEIDNLSEIYINSETLAHNDGLMFEDFVNWFKNYKLNEPMAIIHFTKYRY